MKKFIVILIILISIVGCVTPYQPNGIGGGYSDMALAKDIYKVSFRGNGFTSQDEVQNLLLKRCAELTLNNGYKYFIILQSNIDINSSNYQSPVTVNTSMQGFYQGNVVGNGYYGTGDRYYSTTINPGMSHRINKYTYIAIIKMLINNKHIPQAFDGELILQNI